MIDRSTLLALLAFSIAATAAPPARAAEPPDKAACLTAYVDGQALRRRGALADARAALEICARDPCPAPLHADCGAWLADVDERIFASAPPAIAPAAIAHPAASIAPPIAPPVAPASDPPPRDRPAPPPWAAIALGGAALAATTSFVYFGASGVSGWRACDGGRCSPDDASAVTTSLRVADVSALVAVSTAALAAYLFFTRAHAPREARAPIAIAF